MRSHETVWFKLLNAKAVDSLLTNEDIDTALAEWNDLSRGAQQWIEGADETAQAIDMKPLLSGASPEDEGLYVLHHKHWVSEMLRAIDKERSQFIATATA